MIVGVVKKVSKKRFRPLAQLCFHKFLKMIFGLNKPFFNKKIERSTSWQAEK